MFTFQAIHNIELSALLGLADVKELISMFTFQAIHNAFPRRVPTNPMSKS